MTAAPRFGAPRFAIAVLALIALAVPPAEAKPARQAKALSAPATRGLAFAKSHCSSCHAVTPNRSSTNPESPPFDDIANRPGLAAETFTTFLSDSHNFPEMMDFTLHRSRIDDLSAYMLTLQKKGYRPTR